MSTQRESSSHPEAIQKVNKIKEERQYFDDKQDRQHGYAKAPILRCQAIKELREEKSFSFQDEVESQFPAKENPFMNPGATGEHQDFMENSASFYPTGGARTFQESGIGDSVFQPPEKRVPRMEDLAPVKLPNSLLADYEEEEYDERLNKVKEERATP